MSRSIAACQYQSSDLPGIRDRSKATKRSAVDRWFCTNSNSCASKARLGPRLLGGLGLGSGRGGRLAAGRSRRDRDGADGGGVDREDVDRDVDRDEVDGEGVARSAC